jgi:transcriptional regulator with XRE-family HTH domain
MISLTGLQMRAIRKHNNLTMIQFVKEIHKKTGNLFSCSYVGMVENNLDIPSFKYVL